MLLLSYFFSFLSGILERRNCVPLKYSRKVFNTIGKLYDAYKFHNKCYVCNVKRRERERISMWLEIDHNLTFHSIDVYHKLWTFFLQSISRALDTDVCIDCARLCDSVWKRLGHFLIGDCGWHQQFHLFGLPGVCLSISFYLSCVIVHSHKPSIWGMFVAITYLWNCKFRIFVISIEVLSNVSFAWFGSRFA